jgi:putative membrane protein
MMIILETLARRWYAFIFVAELVWSAWPEGGSRRALRFLMIAFGVTLAGELASTHTAFPYGRYDYIANTHGNELYLWNVPLFVPIAFGVVIWAGRALALGTRPARTRAGLALTGAVFATLLDAVIDPMTARGAEWFMGSLYRWHHGGWWFGIPWSNFGGWLLVSFIVIWIDDALGSRAGDPAARRRGRILAVVVCAFFLTLSVWTRQWAIAGAELVVTGLILSAAALAAEIEPNLLAGSKK